MKHGNFLENRLDERDQSEFQNIGLEDLHNKGKERKVKS